jgi:polyhydroxyalkanoate synthesis regulator phasin
VVKKSLTMGAGAAELVQQEMEARVKEAIDKGREQAQSVAVLVESLGWMFKESVAQVQKTVEETVEKNLARLLASMKIPTRREMNQLKSSLEQLSQQVEQLAKKKTAAKATKKKTAAKPKKAKKTPAKARRR